MAIGRSIRKYTEGEELRSPPPTHNWIVNGEKVYYRATAYAYAKREGLLRIDNENGYSYTLEEIENEMIGYTTNS